MLSQKAFTNRVTQRAIPISNLATSLNDEGICPTTIFIGNAIAVRDSRIGDVSKLGREFVLRFLRRCTYFDSRPATRPKSRNAKAEKALSRFRRVAQREHSEILIKLYVSPSSCREQS